MGKSGRNEEEVEDGEERKEWGRGGIGTSGRNGIVMEVWGREGKRKRNKYITNTLYNKPKPYPHSLPTLMPLQDSYVAMVQAQHVMLLWYNCSL